MKESIIKSINEIMTTGVNYGVFHQYTQDDILDGRSITIKDKKLINFGSCSYMGLEMHPKLKEAAIDAVKRYGTLFASSRGYISFGIYQELEELLSILFKCHVLISTSTSLGHMAVMPIVMDENDAVIYDQQAHYSMQEIAGILSHKNIEIQLLRHNRLDDLEQKIIALRGTHKKIWYVIDGVYSMFGDFAPINELVVLLNKYKQFHLYVDDAHGMSWTGINGTGYVLSQIGELHPKMVMATTQAKGFGSCGGVFLFKDKELRDKVRLWGGSLSHSGPQEPATVAASIASAKIHLSDEIYEIQNKHKQNTDFTNHIFDKYKLTLVSNSNGPVFFVGLGLTKMGYNMVQRLMNDGFYTNLGIFPAVPETNTGVRFTVTTHLTFQDIENLAKSIAYHLPKAMKEEGRNMHDIYRSFKKLVNFESKFGPWQEHFANIEASENSNEINISTYNSITQIDKNEWNNLLGNNGAFDYDCLLNYENTFKDNPKPEDNWKFIYYILRDAKNNPIIATFFTLCLLKDDLLAPASVSKTIEIDRLMNPYFLTSLSLMMGCPLSDGRLMYCDRSNPQWKTALGKLIDSVWDLQEKENASFLLFREFDEDDIDIRDFFISQGFIKFEMPEANYVKNSDLLSIDCFIDQVLNSKKRNHYKKDILPFIDKFDVSYNNFKDSDIPTFYKLYLNVKNNNFGLNTFALPEKLFTTIAKSPNWEIIKIIERESKSIAAVIFCAKTEKAYCPVIIGMDYRFMDIHIYKQSIFQLIKRGLDKEFETVFLGLSATEVKHNLGATSIKQVSYIQMKDNFSASLFESIKINTNKY